MLQPLQKMAATMRMDMIIKMTTNQGVAKEWERRVAEDVVMEMVLAALRRGAGVVTGMRKKDQPN